MEGCVVRQEVNAIIHVGVIEELLEGGIQVLIGNHHGNREHGVKTQGHLWGKRVPNYAREREGGGLCCKK